MVTNIDVMLSIINLVLVNIAFSILFCKSIYCIAIFKIISFLQNFYRVIYV